MLSKISFSALNYAYSYAYTSTCWFPLTTWKFRFLKSEYWFGSKNETFLCNLASQAKIFGLKKAQTALKVHAFCFIRITSIRIPGWDFGFITIGLLFRTINNKNNGHPRPKYTILIKKRVILKRTTLKRCTIFCVSAWRYA